MPEPCNQFHPVNVLIRKARLDQQIGNVHAQQLNRVRLGVAAKIGLTDQLTPRKPDQSITPWRSRGTKRSRSFKR